MRRSRCSAHVRVWSLLGLLILTTHLAQAASEPRLPRRYRGAAGHRRSHLDKLERATQVQTKGLLAERTHHRHHHQHRSGLQEEEGRPVPTWDGGDWWMQEKKRTLYFEPVAGLGNRLRGLASAMIVAREFGVGFKLVWRAEPACNNCSTYYQPFVASWDDLFADPPMPHATNFPGSNLSIWNEDKRLVLKKGMLNGRGHPPDNCTVHWVENYDDLARILTNEWATVQGQEVVCAKGTSWLTRRGEFDAAPFFFKLKPSAMVQRQVDSFKSSVAWSTTQWICSHIRRTDLRIFNESGTGIAAGKLIQVSEYVDKLRMLRDLASDEVRIFVASDDPAAEEEVARAFPQGAVYSVSKESRVYTRGSVEGIQAALVDIILLASCPVLVGTFYSSYSETAKLLGGAYYVQVGAHLLTSSKVHKFDELSRASPS